MGEIMGNFNKISHKLNFFQVFSIHFVLLKRDLRAQENSHRQLLLPMPSFYKNAQYRAHLLLYQLSQRAEKQVHQLRCHQPLPKQQEC